MQNKDNNNMITPSNYYGATGQPTKSRSKLPLIIGIVIAIAAIIGVVVIAVVAINRNNDNYVPATVVFERKNNPILELYSNLEKEQMTLGELRQAISDPSAEITVDGGFGKIALSSYPDDAIYFYINTEEEFNYMDNGEPDEEYTAKDAAAVTTIDSYGPNDIVYYFRYAHNITDDDSIGVSYIDEQDEYEVYDGYEFFNFPTKEEAIKAYLAPVVK